MKILHQNYNPQKKEIIFYLKIFFSSRNNHDKCGTLISIIRDKESPMYVLYEQTDYTQLCGICCWKNRLNADSSFMVFDHYVAISDLSQAKNNKSLCEEGKIL